MILRAAGVWVLLATCAGLTLGLSARLAMRVVALQADIPAGFSFGGSAEVIVFGVLVGAPVALIFWALQRRFRLPAWSGLIVSLAVFSVMAVWPPPAARSALVGVPDSPVVTGALFAGVFLVYGAALEAFGRLTQSR